MIRAGESWTYEEPALNDRGLPVIHNIAEILGCIRQAPDLPYVFPENEDGFQELERKLAGSDFNSPPASSTIKPEPQERKLSDDSTVDMQDVLDTPHIDTASSSEVDHEEPSEADYNQMLWAQAQQQHQQTQQRFSTTQYANEMIAMTQAQQTQTAMAQGPFSQHRHSASAFSFASLDDTSPIYSNISSPIQRTETTSPLKTPWYTSTAVADDFLGTMHPLEMTASYVQGAAQIRGREREQRFSDGFLHTPQIPRASGPLADTLLGDGTIRPGMLDSYGGLGLGQAQLVDPLGFECEVSAALWE